MECRSSVEMNRSKEALVQFEKAHAVGDPNDAFVLGEVNWELGRHAEAVKWLQLSGSNPFVLLRLASSYRSLGDELSAVKVLREGSETSAEAAVKYIQTTNELDLDSAINLLEKHVQNGETDVLIVLADLYSKAGNTAKEIELLRRSVDASEPNALHNLGLALWQ